MEINLKSFGFLDFGAAKAESLGERFSFFENYISSGKNAGMSYLAANMDKRQNPALLVEGAGSVLCFLAPYGQPSGGVAGFAQGVDYHKVVKDRLFAVMEFLSSRFEGFSGRAFCDSAPVLERYWAVRCGLGFIGRNGFLISPRFGLRTIIGVIVCNIPVDRFVPHKPLEVSSCGSCGRCTAACPNGALSEGIVDARRCTSYHTIESKTLYNASPVNFKGWIFGCEECLSVCPWNKAVPALPELESKRDFISGLSTLDWESMSEDEFSARFRDSGLARTGLRKIQNNLIEENAGQHHNHSNY